MISQPWKKYNNLNEEFFKGNIQDLYNNSVSDFFNGSISPVLNPDCDKLDTSYYHWGTKPKKVVDVQLVIENGKSDYKICSTVINIQRIAYRDDTDVAGKGKQKKYTSTHCLFFDFFIPYSKYTLRFVLYHIHEFFKSGESIEAFCGQYSEYFSEGTFKAWLKWLKEHVNMLSKQGGRVVDSKDTWKILSRVIEEIIHNVYHTVCVSLYNLNRFLLQKHVMPHQTHYQHTRILSIYG